MMEFQSDWVDYDQQLGKGGHSEIFPYQSHPGDLQWVIKRIFAKTDKHLIAHLQEIVLGFRCEHPSIIPAKGYHIQKDEQDSFIIFIKFPRMKETLKQLSTRKKNSGTKFSQEELVQIFYSIVCGLEYLHQRRIAHRDIKPSNILMDSYGKANISDIGLGKLIHEEEEHDPLLNYKAGTDGYRAPEALKADGSLTKRGLFQADAYSLGVVMAELCVLDEEIIGPTDDKERDVEGLLRGNHKGYTEGLLGVISRLLKVKAEERASVKEVKEELEELYREILKGEGRIEDIVIDLEPAKGGVNQKIEEVKEIEIEKGDVEKGRRELGKRWKEVFQIEEGKKGLEVKVNEGKCVELSDKEVVDFGRDLGIEELKELKNFEFNIAYCDKISDQGLMGFSNNVVVNLPQLRHFSIDLLRCQKITDIGVKQLFSDMAHGTKDLKYFSLNLASCSQITNESMNSMSESMANYIKNLNSLTINFSRCLQINDDGIQSFAFQMSQGLKYLEYFSISFSRCNITDAGLKGFAGSLEGHLQQMKLLSIDLSRCSKITGEGVIKILENLVIKKKKLQYFVLNLSWCKQFTEEQTILLSEKFPNNLEHLQHLSLDFSCIRSIADRGIHHFSSNVAHALKNLKYLSLNFSLCESITDEGIKSCANSIGTHLSKLKYLEINFSGCEKIANQGVDRLSHIIASKLKHLDHLSIDFSQCEDITDKGFISFFANLGQNLPGLIHLITNFSRCSKLTDKCLTDSFYSLLLLEKLQNLTINLSHCYRVSDEAKERFTNSIKKKADMDKKFSFCIIRGFVGYDIRNRTESRIYLYSYLFF